MSPNSGITVRPNFLIEVFLSRPFTKQTRFDTNKKIKIKKLCFLDVIIHKVTVFVYCNHTKVTNAGIFVASDLL